MNDETWRVAGDEVFAIYFKSLLTTFVW